MCAIPFVPFHHSSITITNHHKKNSLANDKQHWTDQTIRKQENVYPFHGLTPLIHLLRFYRPLNKACFRSFSGFFRSWKSDVVQNGRHSFSLIFPPTLLSPFSFFIFFFIFFLVKGKYEINSRDKFVVNCGKGHVSFMKRCVLRTEKGGISTKWKACVKFHARKFKSRVSRWNLSCVVFRYQCIYLRIVYRRVFCYDESNDAVMGLLINYRLIDNL